MLGQSHGHYGTTVFDPMDGTYLEINICDPCLSQAGKDGDVLMGYPAPQTRAPLVTWPQKRPEQQRGER